MILNEIGEIVNNQLLDLKKISENIFLDEFVIMPNHIHGIIIINADYKCRDVAMQHLYDDEKQILNFSKEYYSNISPKKGTLAKVIHSFKSICTKTINSSQNKIFFAWQPNYYDRIIRNETELEKIRKYIFENPLEMREIDKNNPENIFI